MGKTSKETTENRQRMKRRAAAAGAGAGVVVLAFIVVWFVLSGFMLGFGVDDEYYGDESGSEYGEPADAAAHGENDGQSDSSGIILVNGIRIRSERKT